MGKNIRKKLRLSGAEYTSADGKPKAARSVEPVDCSKCRQKCDTKITTEQRQQLFESFWLLSSYERQKNYVCKQVEETDTKTYLDKDGKPNKKRKQVSRKFYFEIESKKCSVCKTFFMKTLSIGKAYIDHALKNKKDGHFTGSDLRGKHEPHNKLSPSRIDAVKKHIESFPRIDAHYVRNETKRQFLGPHLTLPRMYDLYLEECKKNKTKPVLLERYRNVFNTNYNLSFHVPKKDQCNTCNQYYTAQREGKMTNEQQNVFDKHQQRKKRSREEKAKDKQKCESQSNIHVACFDLQSVLYVPCSLVSLMYYMRELCCYNLTFYSYGDKQGTCFVWSEVHAKRGASEVATCLKLHLQSLPAESDHVVLYSDACDGQNRNKIIASCLLHFVNTIPNIKIIDHKFLESGHTQMEVDSMHAAVEFAKKKTMIFVLSQWDTVIHMARRKKPYKVLPLKYTDIIDFKQFQSNSTKVQKKSETGTKVLWSKMKWLRYTKEEPDVCFFKYDFDDEFEKLKMFGYRSIIQRYPYLPQRKRIYCSYARVVLFLKNSMNITRLYQQKTVSEIVCQSQMPLKIQVTIRIVTN
ncbi:uncharacterized protein LOC128550688 [Mercenaria mercenaria]|uniref:uncharacterized protein LOC128550688 n=1 Tax=Mercenaria mercenaria TaxID=6596 RepID=UPI00234E91E5|nr:uncharacterized protein LOC128550688 [Mercenaria mercenaria]